MTFKWLEKYLLSKPGAVKEFHEAFGVDRYLVGGKMFAMWGGDKEGRPILTLKLAPGRGDDLRRRYPDIVPGYYMNKLHWNSLYLERIAIYLSSINCNMPKHPGAFHFMHMSFK